MAEVSLGFKTYHGSMTGTWSGGSSTSSATDCNRRMQGPVLGQQFPRDQLGVAQRPDPDGDVEILGEQIDVAVVDAE